MLYNNPIRLLMRESVRVWGPEPDFSCILSIGTGVPTAKRLGSMGHQVLFACVNLATHAENIAKGFKEDQGRLLYKEGKYFRFNVAQGLGEVKLEEWQSLDLMDAATKSYLNDVDSHIRKCSDKIRYPHSMVPQDKLRRSSSRSQTTQNFNLAAEIQQGSSSPPARATKQEYVDVNRASSRYFTGRDDILEQLRKYLREEERYSSQTAVLIGLGGIGKTQIALKYFERTRLYYSIVLFVECNTRQESIAAFVRFACLIIDEELRRFPKMTYAEAVNRSGFSSLLDEPATLSMKERHIRIVRSVKAWLSRQEDKFLIIVDNADNPGKIRLREYITPHKNGDIIITTRDADAKVFGRPFAIEEM